MLKVSAFLLFLVNLSVFVTGALLSYFRHDPHPDFERLWAIREAAEAKVDLRKGAYDQEVAKLNEDHRRRQANLTAKSDRLQREIEQEQVHIASYRERMRSEVEKVITHNVNWGVAIRVYDFLGAVFLGFAIQLVAMKYGEPFLDKLTQGIND